MITSIMKTNNDPAKTIVRFFLGLVIFPHGAQKLLGWFGGYGFEGTMGYFTGTLGLPWIVAFLVIMIEFFGSIMLIAGILTRMNALAVFTLFIGIIFISHLEYGFFMDWYGNKAGEGFEYHLLVLGMAGSLIYSGGGRYALDRYILLLFKDRGF